MKKTTKRKSLILLSSGLFVIAFSQILSRFIEFSDFTKGSFVGIGIGLLLISLFFGKLKTVRS